MCLRGVFLDDFIGGIFYVFSFRIVCFFFHGTATTEIYTLSLHDALPISAGIGAASGPAPGHRRRHLLRQQDRKSTRLDSSHVAISYAVFCLKKKKFHLQPFAVQQSSPSPPLSASLFASPLAAYASYFVIL